MAIRKIVSRALTDSLNVDSGTLVVDDTNNRVGIGTATPSVELDIQTTVAGTKFQIQNTGSGGINADLIDTTAQSRIRHVGTILDLGADHNNVGTSDPRLRFRVGNNPQASITGHGGIAFGSDTAAANTLDDYEEGSWTPTYTSSGTDPTFAPNLQDGLYTKIGRVVYASFRLRGAITGTKTGNLRISGLPFTANSGFANGSGGIGLTENFGADNYPTNLRVNQSATYINLQVYDTSDPRDGLFTSVTVTSTGASASSNYIIGHVVYQV